MAYVTGPHDLRIRVARGKIENLSEEKVSCQDVYQNPKKPVLQGKNGCFCVIYIMHCKRIVSKNHHSVSKTVRKKKLLTILLTAPNGRSPWEESTILSHFLLTSQEEFFFISFDNLQFY